MTLKLGQDKQHCKSCSTFHALLPASKYKQLTPYLLR